MTHVPYKGTVPALNDLIGGHIQVLFSDAPPALPLINSGKVRALGVTTGKRMAAVPEIAPIGETVAGYDSAPWQMLAAPAATPRLVVDKLHSELARFAEATSGLRGARVLPLSQAISNGNCATVPRPPAPLPGLIPPERSRAPDWRPHL